MEWTIEQEQRFTELKLRELDDLLSDSEREELTAICSMLVEDEEKTLAPALERLQEENAKLQSLLTELNEGNKAALPLPLPAP